MKVLPQITQPYKYEKKTWKQEIKYNHVCYKINEKKMNMVTEHPTIPKPVISIELFSYFSTLPSNHCNGQKSALHVI